MYTPGALSALLVHLRICVRFLADRTVTQYWHHTVVCLSVCPSACDAVYSDARVGVGVENCTVVLLCIVIAECPVSPHLSISQYNFQLCKRTQYDRLSQKHLGFF